jgi:hypothetical protein
MIVRLQQAEPFRAAGVCTFDWSFAVTDTERYLQQATAFAAQAEMAATEDGRAGFLRLACVYVQLARDAATFERTWGETSLAASISDAA